MSETEYKTSGVELENVLQIIEKRSEERLEYIERQRWSTLVVFVGVLLMFGFLSIFAAWLGNQLPSIPPASLVTINNLRVVGNRNLCPGETLEIRYTLSGEASGVLAWNKTIYRRSPPQVIHTIATQPLVFIGPRMLSVREVLRIEEGLLDVQTGQRIRWFPGLYEKAVSFSTESRATMPAVASVTFSIRENCHVE